MKEHYIVTVDRSNLRIYAFPSGNARLEVVESMNLPSVANDSLTFDGVGTCASASLRRVDSEKQNALSAIDDRTLGEPHATRDVLTMELDTFLQTRPEASWDVAAAPALFDSMITRISLETRSRLRRVISKVLVNAHSEELLAQFAAPVSR